MSEGEGGRDPTTPDEWQDAVDAARAIVTLDAARAYGLVRGGAEVDLERCLWILERGEELGYVPSSVAVHTAMIEYLGMEYRGPTP